MGGQSSPAKRPSEPPLTAATEPLLSCTHIGIAQAKVRRIREWAEDHDQQRIYVLANEAWSELEVVRSINKELRKQLRQARRSKATC